MTGNTSCSIPAPGLPGPVPGPQLAAACPLQEPSFQMVHTTATEPRLAIDESSSLSKDPPTPEQEFADSKSPNKFMVVLHFKKICIPLDITFSGRHHFNSVAFSCPESSIRLGAPRIGGTSKDRTHTHSPVRIPAESQFNETL